MALLGPARLLISEKSATYAIKWSYTIIWQVRVHAMIFSHDFFFQFFRWEHLIYQLGGHDHVIEYVIKKGQVVVERSKSVLV